MPTTVATVTNGAGQVVPASAFPPDTFEVYQSGGAYQCLTTADLFTYPPPSSPRSSITGVLAGSRIVASSFFGLHVEKVANIAAAASETPFAMARSHDSGSGMRWHNINPSSGTFVWTNPDAWVNAMVAQGKEILFMLGFTPNWASASTPSTGKYDDGVTTRATNQPPANIADWDAYVTAVATRYNGVIKYYELWNECNYSSYWAGTAAQLAQLTRRASQIIKAIDATAKIVGPVVQEPENGGTGNAYLQSFLAASDGAVGTGKDWIDVCGIHMYPPKYNYQVHKEQYDNVLASLTAAGKGALEIWNTETGVLQGTSVDDVVQSKWLARSMVLAAALGVARYCLYGYDNDVMGMTARDKAYWREVRTALLSGTMTGCNIAPDGRVACTINGKNYIY